jgi:hypothetical protein
MGPPADQPEVKMTTTHLILLLYLMVIFDVKVKIVVRRR